MFSHSFSATESPFSSKSALWPTESFNGFSLFNPTADPDVFASSLAATVKPSSEVIVIDSSPELSPAYSPPDKEARCGKSGSQRLVYLFQSDPASFASMSMFPRLVTWMVLLITQPTEDPILRRPVGRPGKENYIPLVNCANVWLFSALLVKVTIPWTL